LAAVSLGFLLALFFVLAAVVCLTGVVTASLASGAAFVAILATVESVMICFLLAVLFFAVIPVSPQSKSNGVRNYGTIRIGLRA
jgi:hypothetical protein